MKKYSLAIFSLLAWHSTLSANEADFSRYEQAKIAVSYQGQVGNLAQILAHRFGIVYYAEKSDPMVQVAVNQKADGTLANLLSVINQQLKNQKIQFAIVENKPVLALVGSNVSISTSSQFIGDVVFSEDVAIEKSTETVLAQKADASASKMVELTPEEEAERAKQTLKIQEIVAISQDKNLMAQYTKRRQPVYTLTDVDKKILGLETIRSTKLGTFLVFNTSVDVTKYRVEGDFQDMGKNANLIAILHRQKQPPKTIHIITDRSERVTIHRDN